MSDRPYEQQHTPGSTKDVATEEVRGVGQDAKDSARSVGQTAGAEAQNVAAEARTQVSSLIHQLTEDVTGQAGTQQKRAAEGLHGLAGELTQMAGSADQGGMAAGLAQQAAQRLDGVAGWLETREPADLLDDVRRYARRNPGTFLAAAAIVGFVGGRLTRGLRDDAHEQEPPSSYGGRPSASPVYPATAAAAVTRGVGQPIDGVGQPVPPTDALYDPVPPTDALYDEDIQAMTGGEPVFPTDQRGEPR